MHFPAPHASRHHIGLGRSVRISQTSFHGRLRGQVDDRVHRIGADATRHVRVRPDISLKDGHLGAIVVVAIFHGAGIVVFVKNYDAVAWGVCSGEFMG